MKLSKMTSKQLLDLLSKAGDDDDLRDEIDAELERRQWDDDHRDTAEEDRQAAWSDRYENWRREY